MHLPNIPDSLYSCHCLDKCKRSIMICCFDLMILSPNVTVRIARIRFELVNSAKGDTARNPRGQLSPPPSRSLSNECSAQTLTGPSYITRSLGKTRIHGGSTVPSGAYSNSRTSRPRTRPDNRKLLRRLSATRIMSKTSAIYERG